MKIGLVRHFKVVHPFPGKFLLTAAEVVQWFDGYAQAGVAPNEVDLLGVSWETCLASPLPRAAQTAAAIFPGAITEVHALQEMDARPLLRSRLRLPFMAWAIYIRMLAGSSNPSIREFRDRLAAFADELLARQDNNVLIVSHGFVMLALQQELVRRGFRGKTFRAPQNGVVYLFENQ